MNADYPLTIPRLLARAAAQWPDQPYLQVRAGETVQARTFAQIAVEVETIARGLIEAGIGRGEHIALLAENRPEWVLAYLAISCAGAVIIPLDSLMSPPELANILTLSKARTLLVSRRFHETMKPFTTEQNVQLLSLESDLESSEIPLPRSADATALVDPAPSDLAVIIFTSGTTGFSKGVMLTHGNLCSNVRDVLNAVHIVPSDNFHLLLPLHHTYSSTVNMLVPLGGGARATFATSYKSRDILDDIRITGVTLLVGVPQVYENIMNGMKRAVAEASAFRRFLFHVFDAISVAALRLGIHAGRILFKPLRKQAGMPSLRLMISGGAALRPEVNRYFARLGFTLLQGYGLTETSPILSVNPPHRNRIGSSGPAIPNVELRIDHPDPVSGIGEICGRGPNIMLGYYENPDATSNALRHGWFHTGDAGFLDRHGYLHITGRVKNMIVTAAGKNVYPEEIEAQLNAAPFILESLILGIERKRGAGEELVALLVPDKAAIEAEQQKGHDVDIMAKLQSVIDAYNKSVPTYRSIRSWQVHEAEFEKTSTRKIKRYLYKNVPLT